MTTKKEVIEAGQPLVDALRSAGISVDPYKQAPMAMELFALSLDEKRENVRLWNGIATVTNVHPDPERRQVVFTVTEGKRQVTSTIERYGLYNSTGGQTRQPDDFSFRNNFPIRLPGDPVFTVDNVRRVPDHPNYWRAEVTATLSETTVTHFLVGQDEKHCFVSMLPQKPRSVSHAHNILRPEGVPKSALRQGEWFFVPVPASKQQGLTNFHLRESEQERRMSWSPRRPVRLEEESNHVAAWCSRGVYSPDTKKEPTYAIGAVIDTTGRHEMLMLPVWHQVFRNTEVIPEGATMSRNWD